MYSKNFEEKLLKKAVDSNFNNAELYYENNKSFSVNIFNGEIYQYKNSNSQGINFRGMLNNGNMSASYSEKVDESVIDTLVENAVINGELIESPDLDELFSNKDCNYPIVNVYNEALDNTTADEKIQLAKSMEKIALEADSRVKSVNSCVVGNSESELSISNTEGIELFSKSNVAYAYCSVTVTDNHQTKMGLEKWIGRDFKDLNIEKVAKNAVDKAIKSLGASSIESGKFPVVFDNITSCDLLSVFTSNFYGETVDKGFSKLKGKIDTKIASDIVSVRDDGVLPNHITNNSFDSEGVPTSNKFVIENGVLKTFLHNTKTANKFNVEPTGNGYRPSFKSSISTGTTNFYIMPSNTNFDDLIAPIEYGILITDLAGLHSGVNSVSCNFSLSASGFIIKDGVIDKPVEQITVAGNFLDLLLNIENIGNDLQFDFPSNLGAIGSPSILVKELSISGI